MRPPKPDLDVMHRVLHCHQWAQIADWVNALDALAALNDADIERLAQPSAPPSPTSADDGVVDGQKAPPRG